MYTLIYIITYLFPYSIYFEKQTILQYFPNLYNFTEKIFLLALVNYITIY